MPSTTPPRQALKLILVAVLIGLVWGAMTSGLQTLLPRPLQALANAVSPWVVPAFIAGALARRRDTGMTAGVLACLAEVGGYYSLAALRGFGVFVPVVLMWAAAALPAGLVFGTAGHLWARAHRPMWSGLGTALLAGAFLAEGAVTFGWVLGYIGDAVLFVTVGVLTLLVLPLVTCRVDVATASSGEVRPAGGRGPRQLRAAALWLVPVLALGAAGTALTHYVFSQPIDVTPSAGALGAPGGIWEVASTVQEEAD